uniref:DJ-1/PfpI domain-containing protein n=1 Tax=Biomphalaria glabrata TaxID=6526 RepID=A0A2C9JN08_BIOGL
MNIKAAIILSGCGHMDGSEIRESTFVALELDRCGVSYDFFAPDKDFVPINYATKEEMPEKRNVLIEASRISRGYIIDIDKMDVANYSTLIIPGGFGVMKNLSDIAVNKKNPYIVPSIKNKIIKFWEAKKPIGAVCIAPALVVAALSHLTSIRVTLGELRHSEMIKALGGQYTECDSDDFVVDIENMIFSTPAYMLDRKAHIVLE